MKHLISLLFLLFLLTQAGAQPRPKYILIKKGMFGTWKMIQLATPPRKLHKWYYDEKTNTYYRVKTILGFGLPMDDRLYINPR